MGGGSIARELADDIWQQTGLTPTVRGGFLVVDDGHGGEYVLSSREGTLPDGSTLMMVHDQCQIGADEPTLLLDLTGLTAGAISEARTSAVACTAIVERQATIERLTLASRV